MYNQSGLIGNINHDIFKMRDFMIKDMLMKKNIESNRYRTKNNKNSLLKEHKIIQIKKPISPKQPLQRPIKTFLPIKSPVKNPLNINTLSNRYLVSSPSQVIRPLSNTSSSQYSYTNNVKPTVESGEISYRRQQGYKNHLLDAKRRIINNHGVKIDLQNQKFGAKLKRISSPLNKDRLNNSYSKIKEYRNIAKKVDRTEDNNIRKMNHVRSHLPPLLTKTPNFNGSMNISKSYQILGLSKINSYRKFGA